MHAQGDVLKLIALMLRGSAVLFDSLAASYRKWATLLESRSEGRQKPNWVNER
jgi:hypothetical protein